MKKATPKYKGKLFCGFCQNIQKVEIYKSGGGRHQKVSDQVRCNKCQNYLNQKNKVQ